MNGYTMLVGVAAVSIIAAVAMCRVLWRLDREAAERAAIKAGLRETPVALVGDADWAVVDGWLAGEDAT